MKSTPTKVFFTPYNGKTAAIVSVEQLSDSASVIVPYNFSNSISVSGDGNIAYAGEEKTFKVKINIGEKANSVTDGTYATKAPNVQYRLLVCDQNGNNCDDSSASWSTKETMNPGEYTREGITLQVPDEPAGTKFCIRAQMTPSNSGADTNININNFGGATGLSNKACFTIAKKPSFQVWGGSVYSAGNTKLSQSKKTLGGSVRTFGSWTELGLVGVGKIEGIASGAGTGYANTSDYNAITPSSLGGSNGTKFCNMSTLSFGNNKCDSDWVGGLGSGGILANKSGLVDRFTDTGSGEYTLRRSNNANDITAPIETGTFVYKTPDGSDDFAINNNIVYADIEHSTFADIPKVIIYAKGNINIKCGVERVDAVLIANGNVNTCSDGGSDNDEKRSKQLRVNGSIIARKLILGRTYGAATGNASIVPAEIINYDSSLYLWANNGIRTDGGDSNDYDEVYRAELAHDIMLL